MTQVIIDDVIPRTQLIAAAAQTVFNTNWTADAATDILVYARADGVEPNDVTQLVSSSLYNVTFIGVSETVRVTFLSGRTLDDIITIVRNTPADRLNLYINTNFTPSMLNEDFGILTLVDQQAQMYDIVINPGYNVSATIEPIIDLVLPILGENQIWAMNNDRTAIIAYDVPSGGGVAPSDAKYILQQPDSSLPNAQSISALSSGILIGTTTTGVMISRVLAGTTDQISIANASGIGGSPTFSISANPILSGNAGMGIPQGTTAQRAVPSSGISLRYNTESEFIEFWTGVTWAQIPDSTDFSSLPTGFVSVTTGSGDLNSRLLVPTANQIDITNTDGLGNPAFSLSATLNLPGTFNIQSSTVINQIINDPTMAASTTSNISTSAAIKAYIDSLVTGLNIQGSCVCASTIALTVTYANGAAGVGATLTNAGAQVILTLDGVSPSVGQRVLIKNQASTFQNGIYTVTNVGSISTNWVLTRATDYDTAAEINPGDLVVLTGGTTQAQSSWLETALVNTVGTDPIVFVQFTASLPVNVPSGGTGVTSFTAFAPIVGGTTTTGSLQSITLGAAGTLFQSNGVGVLPGFTTATYPSLATLSGSILRANGTNWIASTSTFADTYAVSTLLYASSTNTISGLATANSSVLITSAGGVPSLSTTLPSGLSATNMILTTPIIAQINDANGNAIMAFSPVASAVNYIATNNAAAGGTVFLFAAGSDSNIPVEVASKGTSPVAIAGGRSGTIPVIFYNGTTLQHATSFAFSNTSASRTVTWPDSDGTVQFAGSIQFSGRLTLTTGTPVTTADVNAAGTIYFTPYKGNQISLYTGAVWTQYTFNEISLSVPGGTNTMYDMFAFDSSGNVTLEALAWTNDTTRATALVLQNGVYCKTGALDRRYLGSFRTKTASQCTNSKAFRHLWNYYNRITSFMLITEPTDTWSYTTATYRQANANAANQLDFVIGVSEDIVSANVIAMASSTVSTTSGFVPGIGVDSTTTQAGTLISNQNNIAGEVQIGHCSYSGYSAVGRHTLVWLEYALASGTTTWYGDAGVPTLLQSGISGTILN